MTRNLIRLKHIRELLKNPMEQCQIEFLTTHPLIRDPAEYAMVAQFAPDPACGGQGGAKRFGAPPPAAVPAQALSQPKP